MADTIGQIIRHPDIFLQGAAKQLAANGLTDRITLGLDGYTADKLAAGSLFAFVRWPVGPLASGRLLSHCGPRPTLEG